MVTVDGQPVTVLDGGTDTQVIAGIYGTVVPGGVPVVIDANGKLGVAVPPDLGGATPASSSAASAFDELREQLAAVTALVQAQAALIAAQLSAIAGQDATNAELR